MLEWADEETAIPGSYWGAPEAGPIGNRLWVRTDTPLHSILHEGSHYLCMTPTRRAALHTNAGGDDLEESAVCFLSIVLASQIANFEQAAMMRDMDTWGYTFRLGSAAAWFSQDAADAAQWLVGHGILDSELHFLGARKDED